MQPSDKKRPLGSQEQIPAPSAARIEMSHMEREREAYTLIANALLIRLGGRVTLSKDELRIAGEANGEFKTLGDGSLQVKISSDG
jgi:hypothetical protein